MLGVKNFCKTVNKFLQLNRVKLIQTLLLKAAIPLSRVSWKVGTAFKCTICWL